MLFDGKMKKDGLRNCQEEHFSKAATFDTMQSSCRKKKIKNEDPEETEPMLLPDHPGLAKKLESFKCQLHKPFQRNVLFSLMMFHYLFIHDTLVYVNA